MENVEWLSEEAVAQRLTFKSDKEVWEEAKQLITENKKLVGELGYRL
jgi:hypothetical protein